MNNHSQRNKPNLLDKSLAVIETLGNKLPDPITLFFILSTLVIIISAIAASLNISVVNPGNDKTISAVSLLTPESIRKIFAEAVNNFTGFKPLGTVLVAMLGVGVAESTGLLSALLKQIVLIAPARFICPVVVFAGVMGNIASDAGYVVLVPLGAVIFLAFRRHPLAGIAAAFAGVSGGYSANLIINPLDPLLAGLSQSAAQLFKPNYQVNATANYYFMIVSTFIITLIAWFVTEKIIEPRLGSYNQQDDDIPMQTLTPSERKGLRWAGFSLLIFAAFIAVLVLPPQGILRDPKTFTIIPSPFIDSIVIIIALGFLIPGIVYGRFSGKIQSDRDVANALGDSMAAMGYYRSHLVSFLEI